jgi:Exostosin family
MGPTHHDHPAMPNRMRVSIISLLFDPRLLQIARSFSRHGHKVTIITTPDPLSRDLDHQDTMTQFRGFPNTKLIPIDTGRPEACDLLVCGFRPAWTNLINGAYGPWFEMAVKIALVYRSARGEWLNRTWGEIKALLNCPALLKISAFTTDDFSPSKSVFRLFAKGAYIGPVLRQKALCDTKAFARLFVPFSSTERRKYLACFAGAREPNRRAQILDHLEFAFRADASLNISHKLHEDAPVDSNNTILWHVSTASNPKRLPFDDYIATLEQSSFCFCVPGFTGTCNRVVESIYRGCLPVVLFEERDRYDLPLVDGENAILVKGPQWGTAYRRIKAFSEDQILKMRQRLKTDADVWLEWEGLEDRLFRKLVPNFDPGLSSHRAF